MKVLIVFAAILVLSVAAGVFVSLYIFGSI